jgi:hypothetical protein
MHENGGPGYTFQRNRSRFIYRLRDFSDEVTVPSVVKESILVLARNYLQAAVREIRIVEVNQNRERGIVC